MRAELKNDLTQALLSDAETDFYQFLEEHGLCGLFEETPENTQIMKIFWQIEKSWLWRNLRWINVNFFIEKIFQFLLAARERALQPDEMAEETPASNTPVWFYGRSLPLKQRNAIIRSYIATGLNQGTTSAASFAVAMLPSGLRRSAYP